MPKDIEEIFDELKDLKEEIESAKTERAEKKGRLSEQMKALKNYGVKTIAEAKKKITTLQKESRALEKDIIAKFEELKESYEW